MAALNMRKVRQNFPHRGASDIPGHVRREMEALPHHLPAGSRIAIGVGSRGIANIAEIVKAVADYWTSIGMRPFIFPAMGSHGAGTAEGQAGVLARYGIENVISTLDVVSLGPTELGIEVFAGKDAWESDGIFLVGRVKWHTSFAGALESGVSKMMAVGMGKQAGAQSAHGAARTHGMEAAIRSVATHLIGTGKMVGGLAILEDAYHDTAQVTALPADRLIEQEQELLKLVKSWMGRLPFDAVDVLIVDEIGKHISGTGMDLKVVNRGVAAQPNHWPGMPRVERIYIRDISPMSYGNAIGIGAADVIHDRVLEKMDFNAGRVNAVTSGSLALVRVPLHFPSDRECFEVAASTVGKADRKDVTVAWIRNTLELSEMALSENLIDLVSGANSLEILEAVEAREFL
ncbi:MAG: hypothetical protein ABJC09_14210 [Terriglobia bacterium]